MRRSRSNNRVVWLLVIAMVVGMMYWSGSTLMTWLRVTLHGR